MTDFRTGDLVAITARVKAVQGDGTLTIEPVGFDFEVDAPSCSSCGAENEKEVDVSFFTVDEPKLIQHGWVRGDVKWAADGERFVYHKDLGAGLHLLNRPDTKQHLEGAWVVFTAANVMSLSDQQPPTGEPFTR